MSKKSTMTVVVLTFVVAFGLSIAFQSLFAWQSPNAAAPGGNVAAPINVGSTAQTKTGNLNVRGITTTMGGLVIATSTPASPVNGQMWLQ